jgi:hypothetical protein
VDRERFQERVVILIGQLLVRELVDSVGEHRDLVDEVLVRPSPQIGVRSSHTNRMARVPVVIVGGRHSRSHSPIAAATRRAGACVSGGIPPVMSERTEQTAGRFESPLLVAAGNDPPGLAATGSLADHRFHRPCPLAQTTARATMG